MSKTTKIQAFPTTFKRESGAKGQITKMLKKDAFHVYETEKVEGGWIVVEIVAVAEKAPSTGKKTNVVGRASGGNWLKQAVTYITNKFVVTSKALATEGNKVWILVNGEKAFWTLRTERAEAILAAI